MKYIIRDREAGNEIARFDSMEEAKAELKKYEEADKKEGTFTEDFYEIVEQLLKVDFFSVQVNYTGEFDSYTQDDWESMAQDRACRCDPYDSTQEMPEDEAKKIEGEFSADDTYPSNKIATVRWAYIREEEE